MLTLICAFKRMWHLVWGYFEVHLAHAATLFIMLA